MNAPGTGNATPEKRTARRVLSLREPHVESLLVGLGIEGSTLEEMRQFCKAWTLSRSLWDINRRRGGIFSGKRLSKEEAGSALKRQLADLEGGAL